MKRFLALFMVLVVIFTFAACGEENKKMTHILLTIMMRNPLKVHSTMAQKLKGKLFSFMLKNMLLIQF